ncbi:MAG: hypothetical protein HOV68_08680 [Streptomycetaceae bacterium]|nr:hypothetical protein [Streptomycetaceae bacterium]
MASIAGWYAIPAVALVLIVIWTAWRGRTRKPLGMRDTVAHYEQFQAVMSRVATTDANDDRGADSETGRDIDRDTDSVADARTDETADTGRNPNAAEPRAAAARDVP